MTITNICSKINILQLKEKIEKNSVNFLFRKLTLKVKFWHFLISPNYPILNIWVDGEVSKIEHHFGK